MFFESLDTQAQRLKVERLSKTCIEQITLNETTSGVEGYAQRTSGTTSRPCSQKQLNEWQCLLDAPRRTSNTRSHFTAAETGRRTLPTPMALGSRSDSTTKGTIIVEQMQTVPTYDSNFTLKCGNPLRMLKVRRRFKMPRRRSAGRWPWSAFLAKQERTQGADRHRQAFEYARTLQRPASRSAPPVGQRKKGDQNSI